MKYVYFVSFAASSGMFGRCEVIRSSKITRLGDIEDIENEIKLKQDMDVVVSSWQLLRTEDEE